MLEGIDVSKWNAVPSREILAPLGFAIARASYGIVPDRRYAAHTRAIRDAGLPCGAYHFGVGWAPVVAQVEVFRRVAANANFWVLDLERDTTKTMSRAQGAEFIRRLKAVASGRMVLLYSSRGTWPGDLGQDANWVADYSGRPDRQGVSPRIPWLIWQYQGSPLDRNRFNGSRDDFARRFRLGSAGAQRPESPAEERDVRFIQASGYAPPPVRWLRVPKGYQTYLFDGTPFVKIGSSTRLPVYGKVDGRSEAYVVRVNTALDPATGRQYPDRLMRHVYVMGRGGELE